MMVDAGFGGSVHLLAAIMPLRSLLGLGFTIDHGHGLASIYLYHYPHTLVFMLAVATFGSTKGSALSAKC